MLWRRGRRRTPRSGAAREACPLKREVSASIVAGRAVPLRDVNRLDSDELLFEAWFTVLGKHRNDVLETARQFVEGRTVLQGFDHSTIWSARASTDCGIVRPRALAALRLITSSNFVGCSTGRSPGFVPLRILST